MKFQMDICSGSKVTEGDGQTDHQTDRPPDNTAYIDPLPDLKTMGLQKNQLRGAKYSLCIRI